MKRSMTQRFALTRSALMIMLHHLFPRRESGIPSSGMDDFDNEGFSLDICVFTHDSYVVVIVFNN